jgi:3-methyladenine DNA glycosylase AlkD
MLSNARNPTRAPQAEAYMKHHFSFFGMETNIRRAVQKAWLEEVKQLTNREERWELIHMLWEKEEREFQYVAIDWINSWPKKWLHPEDADQFKWIISQKSWWDSVDSIASNVLGKWAKLHPEMARETFEEWRYETSFWLQRSCLIYQLKYKKDVDTVYLEDLIRQLLPNKEFFIQKAIGWSLRQLSKFEPQTVKAILDRNPMKGVALKEASKYL